MNKITAVPDNSNGMLHGLRMQSASNQFTVVPYASSHTLARRHLVFSSSQKINWRASLLAVFLAFTSACSTLVPSQPETTLKKQKESITIVLSGMSPAFVEVEREIKKIYKGQTETHVLSSDSDANRSLLIKIQSSDFTAVVAVGFDAAKLAQKLTNKKVIFCQVFNYEDAVLISDSMRGVAATPPVKQLFHAWKLLYPSLKHIGVITGTNLRGLMTEAREAAKKENLELIHIEVRSDKETLYAYKKITPNIQGLWLVPDNRVLSRDVIRDIMSYSVKEGKQVAVFNHELLSMGGLLSAESYYADIAGQVVTQIKHVHSSHGGSIVPLTKTKIKVNSVIAKRFNLRLAGFSNKTKHGH